MNRAKAQPPEGSALSTELRVHQGLSGEILPCANNASATERLISFHAAAQPFPVRLALYGPGTQNGAIWRARYKSYTWHITGKYKDRASGKWKTFHRGTGARTSQDAEKVLRLLIANGASFDASLYRTRLRKAWRGAKYRAARDGRDVSITLDEVVGIYVEQDGRCAVTGIKLDCGDGRGAARCSAFAPSIDRIDSENGYSRDNVRIVCVAANFAMNQWGEEVLEKFATGYLANKIKRSTSNPIGDGHK